MEEVEEEREVEEATLTLTLFDFYWFHNFILSKVPPPPPPLPIVSSHRHNRSLSNDISPSLPMLQVPQPPRLLQTIPSGKESNDVAAVAEAAARSVLITRKGRRGNKSKSLSDLEFEELKGFMDLGFTFAEVDVGARLMSIVPGLQRLKATELAADSASEEAATSTVSRPYLSEAWDDEMEKDPPWRSWRIPVVTAGEGIDMKNHLRFWAQTVASTVR